MHRRLPAIGSLFAIGLTLFPIAPILTGQEVKAQTPSFKIRNKAWRRCLNLQDDQAKNGGLPNVWECVSHADQEWAIESAGNGFYKIRNKAWGKCLNLQDDQVRNGGLPNVWECVSHPDQEWIITRE